jgi:hypothetical protein
MPEPIIGAAKPGVSESQPVTETPEAGGVSTKETSTQAPSDAGRDLAAMLEQERAERAALEARFNRDISQQKSSLQKQQADIERQLKQERLEHEQRVRALEMSQMDESERIAYERERYLEDNARLQQELESAQSKFAQASQFSTAVAGWIGMGIRPEDLILDQGLDELNMSGWTAVQQRLHNLEQQVSAVPPKPAANTQAAQTSQDIKPPAVATQTTGTASAGPTRAEVLKSVAGRFGRENMTQEELDQMVISGQIKPEEAYPHIFAQLPK